MQKVLKYGEIELEAGFEGAQPLATFWNLCSFRVPGNTRPHKNYLQRHVDGRCLPQLVSSVCIVYDTVTSDAVLV